MDGWAETYYKTEEDYINGNNKVLPYAVNCKTHERVGILSKTLKEAGFTYAVTSTGIPNRMTSLLVNMTFRKYAKCPYPVHYETVNKRVYTLEEFMDEVLSKIVTNH
jgi:hypothetical protein